MLNRMLLTTVLLFLFSDVGSAQLLDFYYDENMEGQLVNVDAFAGLEDPSFEYPLSVRRIQENIFVSKDFVARDLNAVQSLERSWVGTYDEERVLGRKFMRFNGTGCLANWFPIRPLYDIPSIPLSGPSLGHYVTVRARQDGPFEAVFGINYFDANSKLIQKNSALISGSEAGVSRGDGDLLKKYTIPVRVPYGAAFGQVWIAAPYADGTTTFDFLNVFTEWRSESNATFNPNANLLRNGGRFFPNPDYHLTGYDFWNAMPGSESGIRIDYWLPELGEKSMLLGQQGRITNLYQVFDVEPNQPYALRFVTDKRLGLYEANPLPHARGWLGIDFFDSSAKKIDQVLFDISQGDSLLEAPIKPVANADFAIAWFYIEPLFRDEVIPFYEVDIHLPFPATPPFAATAVAAKTSVATSSTTTTAKSKKQTAPRSPITPAIALQAKNSLPVTAVNPKPATKPAPKKAASLKPVAK